MTTITLTPSTQVSVRSSSTSSQSEMLAGHSLATNTDALLGFDIALFTSYEGDVILVGFDLSSIPSGVVISSVAFKIQASASGEGQVFGFYKYDYGASATTADWPTSEPATKYASGALNSDGSFSTWSNIGTTLATDVAAGGVLKGLLETPNMYVAGTSGDAVWTISAIQLVVTYAPPEVDLTIASDGIASAAATLISSVRLAGTPAGLATPSVALQSPALLALASDGTSNADANIEGAPQIPVEAGGQASVTGLVRSLIPLEAVATGTGATTGRLTAPVPMAMASAGSSTTAGQVAVVRNDVGSRTPPAGFSSGLQRPPRGTSFRSSGPR